MELSSENRDVIVNSADHVLKTFDRIAAKVDEKLSQSNPRSEDVLIGSQTFTGGQASKNLSGIQSANRQELKAQAAEPAICRVVARGEDGQQRVYYISRANPVVLSGYDAKLASYRSPIGRIAAMPAGSAYLANINGEEQYLEVLERVQLHPKKKKENWDSINNAFENSEHGTFTIDSLRAICAQFDVQSVEDLYESLLADDGSSKLIAGRRKEVLSKIGLRDQPILDQFQDEIFREHLASQILITGPPGTGKTTTLVKRLGQKLDATFLDEDEEHLIEQVTRETNLPHNTSWMMFTPTTLLKQYVKEAFAKEGIAAPESRIQTWDDYRRHLARNILGILKTSTGGVFVIKDQLSLLSEDSIGNPTDLFEEFYAFIQNELLNRLDLGLKNLENSEDKRTLEVEPYIGRIVKSEKRDLLKIYARLEEIKSDLTSLIKELSDESLEIIRKNSVKNLTESDGFFGDFAVFLDSISGVDPYEDDEDEAFDDDEPPVAETITSRREAMNAYGRFLRSYSRTRVQKRKISEASKSGKILQWLGSRLPSEEDIQILGRNALLQNSLRRFVNPDRGYVRDIPRLYGKFRRINLRGQRWYSGKIEKPNHISPLELDLVVLAMLKSARNLLEQNFVKRNITVKRFEYLTSIGKELKNQILVDEATDFSAIQLACMFNLTNTKTKSFFAAGDFNQRITKWGCQSEDQLAWAAKGLYRRAINISYRQSQTLNLFSNAMLETILNTDERIDFPQNIDCGGVPPVLLDSYESLGELAGWLKERIVEIENSLRTLPSIAILVKSESAVQPLAAELNEALGDQNVQAVACPEGQVMGNENDVRVFDIQHIKGLEFEGVFFVDIDELAESMSDRFDKYLYVGATRAATYLGVICKKQFPEKLSPLWDSFSATFA